MFVQNIIKNLQKLPIVIPGSRVACQTLMQVIIKIYFNKVLRSRNDIVLGGNFSNVSFIWLKIILWKPLSRVSITLVFLKLCFLLVRIRFIHVSLLDFNDVLLLIRL